MTAAVRPTSSPADPGGLRLLLIPVLVLALGLAVIGATRPGPPSDGPTIPPPAHTTTTSRPPATATFATLPATHAQPPVTRRTASTMYCLRGTTASGSTARRGVVAVSFGRFHELLGSTWQVTSGPYAGRVFTVEDKGPKAEFDMWTASCSEATTYGRHTITIRRVEEG